MTRPLRHFFYFLFFLLWAGQEAFALDSAFRDLVGVVAQGNGLVAEPEGGLVVEVGGASEGGLAAWDNIDAVDAAFF